MKKLLMAATLLITGFLAVAFVSPRSAAGVARGVASSIRVVLPISISDSRVTIAGMSLGPPAVSSGAGAVSPASTRAAVPSRPSGVAPTSSLLLSEATASSDSHTVATAGQMNCGRFGNGFHGGKHNFSCRNRPFP